MTHQILRYLANRFLADPYRNNQDTSRANAARAAAALREHRREREGVEAYLESLRKRDA